MHGKYKKLHWLVITSPLGIIRINIILLFCVIKLLRNIGAEIYDKLHYF